MEILNVKSNHILQDNIRSNENTFQVGIFKVTIQQKIQFWIELLTTFRVVDMCISTDFDK